MVRLASKLSNFRSLVLRLKSAAWTYTQPIARKYQVIRNFMKQ